VVPVYVRLIDSYPNVIALSRADESDLRAVINPLGLAKRAEYLIKLANRLVSEFDGIVPGDRNALLNLPGIGAYTANAVLSFAFNMPYPVIDSNVIRVFRRFFNLDYSGHKPNRSISELARSLLNDSDSRSYNYGLLDFASEVCRTRDPLCPLCILRNHCRYSGSS
jgi:A/G-specific adenine glycosylase